MKVSLINPVPTLNVVFDYLNEAVNISVNKSNNSTKGIEVALDSGHLSILEHINLTFIIDDVTKDCTHQLVRHRHMSYTQRSDRYAKVHTDLNWYHIPDAIKHNYDSLLIYKEAMNNAANTYNTLLELGIKKEDARSVLPSGRYTNIMVTTNLRAFIHLCNERLCNRAQTEIRELVGAMKHELDLKFNLIDEEDKHNKECLRLLSKLFVPKCEKIGYCTETYYCGREFNKEV